MRTGSYNPKSALWALLGDDAKCLFNKAKDEMTAAEKELSNREWAGEDTSYARAALYQLDYWVSCTAEVTAVQDSLAHLQAALNLVNPPGALTQDADGSFAPGTDLWFLKLDRSTDQILAREWPWPRKPMFLERINDPVRMVTYLQDLCWSDIARCGRDNRKELNLAISVIARLIIKGGQAGYLNGPGFYLAFERFVMDWQDPETGFFGVTYIDDNGREIRTSDLSLTFHMARYVPHLVLWWPRLIDTLLAMKTDRYPQGWLDGGTMKTDHNNYDVVELFYRGWNRMQQRQREAASAAVKEMLDWCLEESVTTDGSLTAPDLSDPIPDSFYFAAAFLDTIGFFDKKKRFWTGELLPGDAEKIRTGMGVQLKNFNPYFTEVADTLVRLGAPEQGRPEASRVYRWADTTPPRTFDTSTRQYLVWYGTNRQPNDPNDPSKGYSSTPDSVVHHGICRVFVPKAHDTGSIGSPLWARILKLKLKSDQLRLLSIIEFEQDLYWHELAAHLAPLSFSERHALIFVHGYNVSFRNAALRAAQIGFDLSIGGAMAFFSWPSRGRVKGYVPDETAVEESEIYITDFLSDFAEKSGASALHIIAHSMGNRCILRAMNRIAANAQTRSGKPFSQIILAAADVNAGTFRQLSAAYAQVASRTTLYVSARDRALEASRWLHGFPRAGLTPPTLVVPGIDTINVTGVDLTMLGHGFVAEARPVLTDMHALIRRGDPPAQRFGLEETKNEQGDRCWLIRA
jgi:esterase/lipase superfamily enzyme